jgi:two-component system phosphate regulon response regulator OmpR
MTKKILVIDDDTRLRNLLGRFLEENNFAVFLAKDANEAKEIIANNSFDLMIIDVMMPAQNGIELTSEIRKINSTPIIMLTARGNFQDRIMGLEAGADDYLPKPFEPKELLLRINNILKRIDNKQTKEVEESCKFGEFILNYKELRLKKNDNFIHITESESRILKALCQNKGNIISRENLAKICGNIDERSIDVQITRLRRKIENNPKQPIHLQTARNQGYILYD